MKLVDNWKIVLLQAWSVRAQVFAALLGSFAMLLELLPGFVSLSANQLIWLVGLGAVVNILGIYLRIKPQPEMQK